MLQMKFELNRIRRERRSETPREGRSETPRVQRLLEGDIRDTEDFSRIKKGEPEGKKCHVKNTIFFFLKTLVRILEGDWKVVGREL